MERPGADESEAVRALLRERLGPAVGDLERLAGGEFSRAFGVRHDGRAYVVRVSAYPHSEEAFAKDEYAWRHFGSAALPIPRIVARGRHDDGFFAISERAEGGRLSELAPAGQLAHLPATLDTLDAIGRADVGGSGGYGAWGADGQAHFASWPEFLLDVMENKREGFYRDWHGLFESSFLERPVYERIFDRMRELLGHCPAERALLHCDYHFDNVLSDGRRVSAVVDWGNSAYGDRLYDLAWVGWVYAKDYGIDALTPLRERHGAAPSYDERMDCYLCRLGLDDLRFFARTGRRAQYEWARDRLLEFVERAG